MTFYFSTCHSNVILEHHQETFPPIAPHQPINSSKALHQRISTISTFHNGNLINIDLVLKQEWKASRTERRQNICNVVSSLGNSKEIPHTEHKMCQLRWHSWKITFIVPFPFPSRSHAFNLPWYPPQTTVSSLYRFYSFKCHFICFNVPRQQKPNTSNCSPETRESTAAILA